MKYYDLLIGIGAFIAAHVLTFFQLNGQFFKMDWFRKNEIIVAAFGFILSFFIFGELNMRFSGFNGLLWPARFIGFGVGMIIYAIGVSYFFNEGITTKTAVSLIISISLICIQVLWK